MVDRFRLNAEHRQPSCSRTQHHGVTAAEHRQQPLQPASPELGTRT
jgi:hypothetical protein